VFYLAVYPSFILEILFRSSIKDLDICTVGPTGEVEVCLCASTFFMPIVFGDDSRNELFVDILIERSFH
jgi:hypothetical protein